MFSFTAYIIILAVVIWLLALILSCVTSCNATKPNETNGQPNNLQQHPQRQSGLAALTDAIHTYRRARGTQEGHRSKRENATIAILGATAAFALTAAGASIWSAWIFSGQLEAQRADQRPWIKIIPRIIGSFEFFPQSDGTIAARVPLDFDMKNIGKSPAIEARVVAFPIIYSERILSDEKTLCDDAKNTASVAATKITSIIPNLVKYTTILPEEIGNASNGVLVLSGQEIKWLKDFMNGMGRPNRLVPEVIGCAIYRMGWEDTGKWHQTRFIYDVYGTDRDIDSERGDIPSTGLGFRPGDPRGFYAD